MKTKPKFGVDLDGCTYSFDYGARQLLRLRGNDIAVDESPYWNAIADEVPAEEWRWVWGDGCREVFRTAPPYPGAIEALRKMEAYVDICIITHRPLRVADVTLRRLADDKLHPAAVFHCAGSDKSLVMPDCIGYVEDRPENAHDLVCAHDGPVFMPRRSYNRGYLADVSVTLDIVPFDDWKEVLNWVKNVTA